MLYENEVRFLEKIKNRLFSVEKKINTLSISGNRERTPGVYPGKAIPHTESVKIFVGTDTNVYNGNINISADGPFVAHRLNFSTATAMNELMTRTPGSAEYFEQYFTRCSSIDSWIETGNFGVDFQMTDFYWMYQVTGEKRYRQNIPVPSSLVARAEDGRGFWEFSIHDIFPPSSTVTVGLMITSVSTIQNPRYPQYITCSFHGVYLQS